MSSRIASPAPPPRWRRNSVSSNVLPRLCSTPLSGRDYATTWRGWPAASAAAASPPICTSCVPMAGSRHRRPSPESPYRLCSRDRLITFDVGGTSADIGIVVDGRFAEATARDTWIGGYPVLAPMIDIHTIGAGGGSIAYLDSAGAFRVGPRSAGADPGPAAYGQGGAEPTVTDANLVLGRLGAA